MGSSYIQTTDLNILLFMLRDMGISVQQYFNSCLNSALKVRFGALKSHYIKSSYSLSDWKYGWEGSVS